MIANDNLIDIAQYNPHLRLYLDKNSRDIAEKRLGKAALMLYYYERGQIDVEDVIEIAIKENAMTVLNRVLSRTKDSYAAKKLVNYSAICAAQEGHSAIVNDLVTGFKGNNVRADNYTWIAKYAARIGCKEIVYDMIKRGEVSYTWIAAYAAKGNHRNIVYEMIALGPCNYKLIACCASEEGYSSLAREMYELNYKS